jgi:predicted nucleotidyltransferase
MDKAADSLKAFFEVRPSVLLAFLFGSRAGSEHRVDSDWDIGVYFTPAEYGELDSGLEYPGEEDLWQGLIDVLQTDAVDMVVLNRANLSLVSDVLRDGYPLAVKNKGLYLDLQLKADRWAEDWRAFARDYYEISERAQSIPPGERERLMCWKK